MVSSKAAAFSYPFLPFSFAFYLDVVEESSKRTWVNRLERLQACLREAASAKAGRTLNRIGLLTLHVRKDTIRKDPDPTILISIEGLINIIRRVLGTILCLAGHVSINNEFVFWLHDKDMTSIPYGAGPAISNIPHMNPGLISDGNARFTAGGVLACRSKYRKQSQTKNHNNGNQPLKGNSLKDELILKHPGLPKHPSQ